MAFWRVAIGEFIFTFMLFPSKLQETRTGTLLRDLTEESHYEPSIDLHKILHGSKQ